MGNRDGADLIRVIFATGHAAVKATGLKPDKTVYVSVRPEKLKCATTSVPGFNLRGLVKEHIYVGSVIKTIIELSNRQEVTMSLLAGAPLIPLGETVWVYWEKEDTVVLHANEETPSSLCEQVPKIEVRA
ncbi:Transport-associated OB, type 2 [Acididesulfobacillus acetoxydans]|uniref:Molybdate/tungstate binding, C-terminal n=1 Tax=Acididesulfobacillus acetoxydans TaxID=1561005 RepID=A0A8S0W5Q8_9FIRM|nr:TOBE domain-containing protein [Acididesulfobacillus acetoxydans]CAA7603398.1 Transport-associated OB, type 2 [Acididesulfobacillus acetoxydans]CEJ06505.1 Molybdate/tungstate binding, C-terminal [Acididesulfobacillus acetoxydans]